jgi:hypothetical protein
MWFDANQKVKTQPNQTPNDKQTNSLYGRVKQGQGFGAPTTGKQTLVPGDRALSSRTVTEPARRPVRR